MTTRRALVLDAALALMLVLSVAGLLRSPDLHGALSFGLIAGVVAHAAVHRRWIVRALTRARTARWGRTTRDLTMATALAAVFVPMAVTGFSLFSTLDRGDDLHTVSGWLFIALVALHVGLHTRWIRGATTSVLSTPKRS